MTDATSEWVSPWNRRSAVRVTTAVRPAWLPLHAADEYGEVDAELRVGRDGITVELDGATIEFPRPPTGADAIPDFVRRRQRITIESVHGAGELVERLLEADKRVGLRYVFVTRYNVARHEQ